MRNTSHLTPHTSHLTPHTSHITHHTSHTTHHNTSPVLNEDPFGCRVQLLVHLFVAFFSDRAHLQRVTASAIAMVISAAASITCDSASFCSLAFSSINFRSRAANAS
jgi:hypothetical protein